jgi:hypothetical protein
MILFGRFNTKALTEVTAIGKSLQLLSQICAYTNVCIHLAYMNVFTHLILWVSINTVLPPLTLTSFRTRLNALKPFYKRVHKFIQVKHKLLRLKLSLSKPQYGRIKCIWEQWNCKRSNVSIKKITYIYERKLPYHDSNNLAHNLQQNADYRTKQGWTLCHLVHYGHRIAQMQRNSKRHGTQFENLY